jgi:hypothetical protein
MDLMRRGAFEEAWKFSDEVLKSGVNRDYHNIPRHYQCIWDGTPLEGKKVLVRCYHGLGDTIQFIRYIPLVKAVASEVLVWAHPKLLELFKSIRGIDRFMPLHDGAPDAVYDVDVEIMELAHIFRTTPDTIPLEMPYLHASSVPLPEHGNNILVGLVWEGGNWDNNRSISFDSLMPLFSIDGIDIIILQDEASKAGWKEGYGYYPGDLDIFNLAGYINSIDLLITIDSMPAHLAGALNIPVWVMLNSPCDWRWMEGRSDNPWYPSMKLFRKKKDEEWDTLIFSVTEELMIKLRSKSIKRT